MTGCYFTNVQYIFGVQILLLQIMKLNYQIQISNSFRFFVNTNKCQYLHYQMSICNRNSDICIFMTGTYSSNFVFIFAIRILHLKLQKSTTKSDNRTRTSVTLCKKHLHFCTIKCKLYPMKIQIAFVREGHIYSRKLQFVDANFAFESANNEFEKVKLHIWTYS